MGKFDPTVAIVGRVGTDPEVKEGRNGKYVSFRLVRDFRNMDGSVKGTKWYSVSVDGLDSIPELVVKGAEIEVRGKQRVAPAKEKSEAFYSISVAGVEDIAKPRLGKNGQPTESFAIEGRVGRDPETLTAKSGREYYKFSLAHNYSVRTEDGEWEDFPVWYNVLFFGDELPAAVVKGALVEVRGVDEVRTYHSTKYNEEREDCSIRAFQIGVPDSSKVARAAQASDAAGGAAAEEFEAPF